MKIINRIPTASDQIERETAKLFNTKLSVFLGYAFPLICGLGDVYKRQILAHTKAEKHSQGILKACY